MDRGYCDSIHFANISLAYAISIHSSYFVMVFHRYFSVPVVSRVQCFMPSGVRDVVLACPVLQIVSSVICPGPVLVANLKPGGARTYESSGHKPVDEVCFSAQSHTRVPDRSQTRFEKMALFPVWIQGSASGWLVEYSGQRPDAALITHFILILVAHNGAPLFFHVLVLL